MLRSLTNDNFCTQPHNLHNFKTNSERFRENLDIQFSLKAPQEINLAIYQLSEPHKRYPGLENDNPIIQYSHHSIIPVC